MRLVNLVRAAVRPGRIPQALFLAAAVAVLGQARATLAQDICHIPDIDAFLEKCPTNDAALGRILSDFTIAKDGVPVVFQASACTEPISAQPIAQYTDELSVLQTLRTVYHLDRDRCGHLPWTPLSLYDWLRSKVGGFNIDSAATFNSCCGTWPDGRHYMTLIVSDETTREYHKTWEGLAEYIALLMHEARHVDGFGHVGCCPVGAGACDSVYDEASLSPYGIQYWLERSWVDGTLHTGYTCLSPARQTAIENWLRGAANGRLDRFCSNPPPALTDANNQPPPCDSTCLATVSCIAPAHGVPPSGGPPRWWSTSPPEPAYHDRLDDPRWAGAAKITHADGTGEKAELRALHDTTHLYLSWRSFAAPASAPEQNKLFFGYQKAGGGDVVVEIGLTDLSTVTASTSHLQLRAFLRNPDGTEGSSITLPPEVSATARVWVDASPPGSWAVQLQLPIGGLASICGRFKLWYELLSGTPTEPVTAVTWPRTGADIDGGTSGSPHAFLYPDPATWHWFRPSTGPGDASCATAGVSLDVVNIGTRNSPASEILYRATEPFPANMLFARPTNHSGATLPAGAITATFRLANWGSVPGDWEQGVPMDQLWATIPGGADVATAGPIADDSTAGDANEARFEWTVAGDDLADFLSGARRPHQCMLVELKSAAAPGVVFTNSSVYRNMDFGVSASTFKRDAELSIKGLAPVSTEPRDVFIYVETQNMPATVEGERRAGMMAASGPEAVRPPATYRVHVYHDTGRVLALGGTPRPVLRYQTSFGYVVTHKGELRGWRHRIDGPGLVKLAPGWYKIPVPNQGAVRVTTEIEAVPPSRWSLSLHLGAARPLGSTRNLYDDGPSGGIGLEYRVNDRFGVELFFGRHALAGRMGGEDLEATEAGVSAKTYLWPGLVRPFFEIGAGVYDLAPGPSKGGIHTGFGAQRILSPKVALEATAKYHNVTTSAPRLQFATAQAGLRIRF